MFPQFPCINVLYVFLFDLYVLFARPVLGISIIYVLSISFHNLHSDVYSSCLVFHLYSQSLGFSFAAGFDSNPSYNITQLYPYRLCWFTPRVIYYFLTIPVCIFILLNFLTIVFVGKQIINHARHATSRHKSYERAKRCVVVLLSSCVTQGIGWLFGPFISFIDPTCWQCLRMVFHCFQWT